MGDVFLLCSDGLTKLLSDTEISRTLGRSNSPNAVHSLIEQALQRGADDNVTVSVVSMHAPDPEDDDANTIPLENLQHDYRPK